MKALIERIRKEAVYLGNGIVKIDSLINHQLDGPLTTAMGEAFANRFHKAGVTAIDRVVTAEVSGIAPGLSVAQALGVPMVFARKKRPVTMTDTLYQADAPSHTKGGVVSLFIASEYLKAGENVLLIDDFLASGNTLSAMVDIIRQAEANLVGIGCVVEKPFEGGREKLSALEVPIITLARIHVNNDHLSVD